MTETSTMVTRIRQETALADRRVVGWFRYRDLFQVLPMPVGAPVLQFAIGHHPFLLELSYAVPDVSETGYNPEIPSHALLPLIDDEACSRPRKEILLLLSTLSRHLVFHYSSSMLDQQWFVRLPMNERDSPTSCDSVWGQAAYCSTQVPTRPLEGFSPVEAQPIGLVEPNEYFGSDLPRQYVLGETHDQFELPATINEYLDAYYSVSDHGTRKAFLSACSLLRQGVQLLGLAPSLAFAACASSLETLIAHDHLGQEVERCESCDQLKYHVRRRFLEFIRTYGADTPEGKKQADWIYTRRCSILHQGQLFLGEIEPRTMNNAMDWIADAQSLRSIIRFFRICIVNWLVRLKGR